MKTCPVCGLHIEDDYLYCWEDGARLVGEPVPNSRSTEFSSHLPSNESAAPDINSPPASLDFESNTDRVLCCPLCAREFPLTFSTCPNCNLALAAKHVRRGAEPRLSVNEADARILVVEAPAKEKQTVDAEFNDYNEDAREHLPSQASSYYASRPDFTNAKSAAAQNPEEGTRFYAAGVESTNGNSVAAREPDKATSYAGSNEPLPDEFESCRVIRGAKPAYKKPTSDPVLLALYPPEYSQTSESSLPTRIDKRAGSASADERQDATTYSASAEPLPDEFESCRVIRGAKPAYKKPTSDPVLLALYPPEYSQTSESSLPTRIDKRAGSASADEPQDATTYSASDEPVPDEFESCRVIRGAKQAYKKPTSDPVLASLYPPSESTETSSVPTEPVEAASYSGLTELLPDEFASWRVIRRARQAFKKPTSDPVLQSLYPPESSENSEPSPPIGINEQAGSSEPRGMQFVARVTSVALFFVTLAAIYLVYTQVTRSPSPPQSSALESSTPTPEIAGSAQSPLITTPPEARDYREEVEQPASVEEPAPSIPYESPRSFAYEEPRPRISGRSSKASPPPAPFVPENRQPRVSGRSSKASPAPAPFALQNRQPRISGRSSKASPGPAPFVLQNRQPQLSARSSPRLAPPQSNPKSFSPAQPTTPRAPTNIPDATVQYERKRRVLPLPSDAGFSPAPPRFNAQLIRMRSYRSLAGYRYNLTFMLSEQTGRPIKWDRLSVSTRAESGATYLESIPFQYRLAGSGALTFSLDVEMPGATEADWRGYIVCTSVGADDVGRPLRTNFSVNVAP